MVTLYKGKTNNFNNSQNFYYIFFFSRMHAFGHKTLSVRNPSSWFEFFSIIDFFKALFNIFFWLKIRFLYYINNWVYTTNHKRIAVNYFWFVILSGIVGMVLATLLRLEFAYPGVGIFVGDSLQYLSMVTAHGVIMVFFMIMPLLFGAFANFLLPTQLGVHDVAFPRLNSAAFWFLPGGLLMLCQLVCVDRRYQRMNCFNIREVQSLLKRKFFVDLVNTHDAHALLDSTTMGVRFKTNSINAINSNMFTFYNYGLDFTAKVRTSTYSSSTELNTNNIFSLNTNSIFYFVVDLTKNLNFFFYLNNAYVYFFKSLSFVFNIILNLKTLLNGFLWTTFFFLNHGFLIFTNFLNNIFIFSVLTSSLTHNFQSWFYYFTYLPLNVATIAFELFLNLWNNYFYLYFNWLNLQLFMSTLTLHVTTWFANLTFGSFFAFLLNDMLISIYEFVFFLQYLEIYSLNNIFFAEIKNFFNNNYFLNFMSIQWNIYVNYFVNSSFSFFYIVNSFFLIFNSFISLIFFSIVYYLTLLFDSIILSIFNVQTNFLFDMIYNCYYFSFKNVFLSENKFQVQSYMSNYFTTSNANLINKYSNEEMSETTRYWRFSNPIFKYDYKSGDYFPKLSKEMYTYLFSTISDLTSGIRATWWFNSDKYNEIFLINFNNFFNNIVNVNISNNQFLHSWSGSRFNSTDGFYNFFYLLSQDVDFINKRWIAINTLNQKFYRMFNTSSMQQRIYANWRQLKFTREAWRCKLLAARHQKTLFRRYVHEDGVFWSIERNARDLLPGWAMITPFSARTRFTAIGKTDIGLMGVLVVLNSSIISAANFLVTYRYLSTLNNRKMRDARAFFTEGIMVASWMMIAANPMLIIGIIMLLSDRHWQTSFFDYSGGGDTVLFQHMFWFFGHPEVYIIVIPTFGFTNTILSFYLRKRISARASLLYSMYTIAFLGFFVWGHHMYMVGLAHTTRMLFSTLTVMISVPAATKIMHWCVTFVNSSIATELPVLFAMTFIFFFVTGGISGMCVAHTGMDVLFHDTFYVVGHFHVMLAGSAMFSSFGGFYFYFPAIFGVKFSRIYAYLHYSYYLIGQLMTVIPMMWLGYSGMPRRVLDYPASMGGWHSVISAGHMLSVAGLMAFFIMIFDSLRQGRAVIRNTFGISRYNTRLNFYLYEIANLVYVQQKGWTFFKFIKSSSIKLNNYNYSNYEPYETTLITYTFAKK